MNQNQSNFMDSKTLIAILLLGVVWMGWQSYMAKKYPQPKKAAVTAQSQNGEANPTNKASSPNSAQANTAAAAVIAEAQTNGGEKSNFKILPETFVKFQDDNMTFKLSSKGMGLKELILNKYTDRSGDLYKFVSYGNDSPFKTFLIGNPADLDFAIEKVGENQFIGIAHVDGLEVKKTIEVDSKNYLLTTNIFVSGENTRFLGLGTTLIQNVKNISQSTFLPTFERQEFYYVADGNSERVMITPDEVISKAEAKISVASLGTQYFSQSVVDQSGVLPEFRYEVDHTTKLAKGSLLYSVLNKKSDFKLTYQSFIGPKYLHILEGVNQNLAGIIDFGIFSWLAKPMLQLMKWFYSMVGNWGFAIILLTILVRIIVLPFMMMSYKSMNKMKLIQPQIKALKEKYKDEPQKLNQEMMQLMRSQKVNPLGGCLPMLLQFPVFIALYQVLGQSIELYQAPFGLWITDLSLKDPYYVLPVLMAVTMFIQQKITPTAMDPAQAKVMMFLPVVFALFMIGLPSGLTLYIFVSALFAILQQMFFMRDTLTSPTAA